MKTCPPEALRRRIQASHAGKAISYGPLPVKGVWWEKADVKIIRRSLTHLIGMPIEKTQTCVLPRPGCGSGGLAWSEVRPICEQALDDRFCIVSLPGDPL